jgi:DNA-directed RNA polymerase specialized sigma24 family protein
MPASHDIDPGLEAAYRDALARLPVLSRVVLQLHQRDDLPFSEIAHRLSIDPVAVMAFVAEALGMVAAMLDGDRPRRWRAAQIVPAETDLRQRHRIYCEDRLRAMGIGRPITWQKMDDDDLTVSIMLLRTLPQPLRKTAYLYFCDKLSLARIAARMRTAPGLVQRRMLDVFHRVENGPERFEDWLRNLGRSSARPVHGA